jgi:predicted ArsR family transcriptional regulator
VQTVRERLRAAAEELSSLGGLAEVEVDADGRLQVRGFSCPLGDVVVDHPELCQVAEALVAEITGMPVHECCAREAGAPPHCCFELR